MLKRQNRKGSMLGGFLILVQRACLHRVHSLRVIWWVGCTLNVLCINISEFTFCVLFQTTLHFRRIQPAFDIYYYTQIQIVISPILKQWSIWCHLRWALCKVCSVYHIIRYTRLCCCDSTEIIKMSLCFQEMQHINVHGAFLFPWRL